MAPAAPISLNVNGHRVETAAVPETPLLYVLRNDLGLKGTRFGCGRQGPHRGNDEEPGHSIQRQTDMHE